MDAVEVLPLEQPVEASVETVIDPSLIEAVQKNGDVLDSLKDNLRRYPMHTVIRAGMLATAAASGILRDGTELNGRFIAYGLGAAGLAEINRRRHNRKTAKLIDAQLDTVAKLVDTTGENLELIRHGRRAGGKKVLDLFWSNDPDVELDKHADVKESLERITKIAESSQLEVVLPASVLDFVDKGEREVFEERAMPVSDWLKQTKGLPVEQLTPERKAQKEVLVLTADECQQLAELIELVEDNESFSAFKYAWTILRQEKPSHTMFQRYASKYDTLADTSKRNGVHAEARQHLSNVIASHLDNTAVQRGPSFEHVVIPMRALISKTEPKAHFQGTTSLVTTSGEISMHAEDTTGLLANMGINTIDLRQFFTSPGSLSQRKRGEVAEVVMLFELSGWELPYDPASETVEDIDMLVHDEEDYVPTSLQQSTALAASIVSRSRKNQLSDDDHTSAERIRFERFNKQRAVRLIAAMAVALALAKGGGKAINEPANYLYHHEVTEYIHDLPNRNLDQLLKSVNKDSSTPVSKTELQKMIAQAQKDHDVPMDLFNDFQRRKGDPYNQALSRAYDIDTKIDNLEHGQGLQFGSSTGDGGSGGGTAGTSSADAQNKSDDAAQQAEQAGVGNVDNSGKNQPVWLLKGTGLSTEGYWSESTFNLITSNPAGHGEGGLTWGERRRGYDVLHSGAAPKVLTLHKPSQLPKGQPSIEVSSVQGRTMNQFYGDDQGSYFESIPVLSGTAPIALQAGVAEAGSNEQHPIKADIVQLKDGTFGVVAYRSSKDTLNSQKLYLTYWLAPSSQQHLPYGDVHANGSTTDHDLTFPGEKLPDTKLGSVPAEVNKYVPGLPAAGLARSQALATFMGTKFDYATAPFSTFKTKNGSETADQRTGDFVQYTDLVLRGLKANCNVANTLIAIDNPKDLNAVTGYHNSRSPKSAYDTLSSSESHLWDVNSSGTVVDGTPSKGLSAADAKFFQEDFTAKDLTEPKSQADEEKKREHEIQLAFEAAGGLIAGGYLFARRKAIANTVRQTKDGVRQKQITHAEKRLGKILTSKPERASLAIQVIGYASRQGDHQLVTQKETDLNTDRLRTTLRINQLVAGDQPNAKQNITAAKKSGKLASQNRKTIRLAKRLVHLHSVASRTNSSDE